MDWSRYPNFSEKEFRCKETGECRMRPEFMEFLQLCRDALPFPFIISSGYRSRNHSIERVKSHPGEHTLGLACDIRTHGQRAQDLIVVAYGFGCRRFGVQQKGDLSGRYIHLGWGDKACGFPPTIWTY